MEKLQKIIIDFEDWTNKECTTDELLLKADQYKMLFEDELDILLQDQLNAFIEEGGEKSDFVAKKYPEETKFAELMQSVKDRKQQEEDAIKAELDANLKAKQGIIDELRNLIENEEHIGKAFDRFNELRENWKTIGNVSAHDYKPLQAEFSNLLEAFFYNINIYKELKEHDLKRNVQLREELTAKMEALLEEKSIKQVQQLAGTYLSEWDEIGPVHKDDWTKVRDKFKTISKKVFQRVKDHYATIKEQHEANLIAKEAIIEEVRGIVSRELNAESDWRKATQEVLDLQKKWKTIGFATKKDNDRIWEEFRKECDLFFDRKGKFYDKAKASWEQNKEKKLELIEKAEALKDSTDWKETTFQMVRLQKDWKHAGKISHTQERKLWTKFKAACDHFFNAKKEYFDTLDDRLADNLKAKKAFIQSLEKLKLEGDKEKDRALIKSKVAEWNKLGMVPKNDMKAIGEEFTQAIDKLYGQMGKDGASEDIRYQDRIDTLVENNKGEKLLEDEKRFLLNKIDVLSKEKLQYENNLSFLGFSKGKAADKMREDVQKKIAAVQSQIDNWDKKLRVVKKNLRAVKKQEESTSTAESAE